jgi:(p)ppGpp synthase/HD superfamily hydrolase
MNAIIVANAISFAQRNHSTQFRTNKEPYFNHVFRVFMSVVRNVSNPKVPLLCGSVLHDVREDCQVTWDELNQYFGEETANIVEELTNKDDKTKSRKERISARNEKYATFSREALIIKCYDRIDNLATIIEKGKSFAEIYLNESLEMLYIFNKAKYKDEDVAIARFDLSNAIATLSNSIK